jgi:four helix bundle protein
VAANIAEGYSRYYKGSLRQFFSIARGSSFEADYWLEIFLDLNEFDKKKLNEFVATNTEVTKMLTSLMKRNLVKPV